MYKDPAPSEPRHQEAFDATCTYLLFEHILNNNHSKTTYFPPPIAMGLSKVLERLQPAHQRGTAQQAETANEAVKAPKEHRSSNSKMDKALPEGTLGHSGPRREEDVQVSDGMARMDAFTHALFVPR